MVLLQVQQVGSSAALVDQLFDVLVSRHALGVRFHFQKVLISLLRLFVLVSFAKDHGQTTEERGGLVGHQGRKFTEAVSLTYREIGMLTVRWQIKVG